MYLVYLRVCESKRHNSICIYADEMHHKVLIELGGMGEGEIELLEDKQAVKSIPV